MIPYARQQISEADIAAVEAVLRSDWLTTGPQVPAFESAIAAKVEAHHAVAVNSATSALHIACLALGLGEGDWLWTSPNSFVASANVALLCGAQVDFVDIDPRSYVMSADSLAAKLERAEREGRLPKVVMPVQFAGQCADMKAIAALARRYGFRLLEDASHAVGARYDVQPVGACLLSDITVFSFHPVKIMTTGEGGVALTRDPDLARAMRLLRSHGVTREAEQLEAEPEGAWVYEQQELGLNYRMTDLSAALGLSQLKRLDEFLRQRHRLARRYEALLADAPLTPPYQDPRSHSALHLFPIQVAQRAEVFRRMREAGIGVNVHYIPVHTQPFYRRRGFAWGDFPVAEAYYRQAISLPLYVGLSQSAQDQVVAALLAALAEV